MLPRLMLIKVAFKDSLLDIYLSQFDLTISFKSTSKSSTIFEKERVKLPLRFY